MSWLRRFLAKGGPASRPLFRGERNVSKVSVDGVQFLLARTTPEFCAAIEKEGRGVFRFRSLEYGAVLVEVTRWLQKKYGESSRQNRDLVPSILLCAGCFWEFPGSYVMSLQAPEMFGGRVFGATPGFDLFGKTGACPQCGTQESLLVYETFPSEGVTQADVEAIAGYWQDRARSWWEGQHRQEASCDRCSVEVSRGQGYLSGNDLICEDCMRKGFLTEGLTNLRRDPHYYGQALLRKARVFRN